MVPYENKGHNTNNSGLLQGFIFGSFWYNVIPYIAKSCEIGCLRKLYNIKAKLLQAASLSDTFTLKYIFFEILLRNEEFNLLSWDALS